MFSDALLATIRNQSRPVAGLSDFRQIGELESNYESHEALKFLGELIDQLREPLAQVLKQRRLDREFLDARLKAGADILGAEDSKGRIVMGPKSADFVRAQGQPVAPLPKHLEGIHVTLFGPPDDAKLSVNAMNAFHRRIKDEPPIVSELLRTSGNPFWGADDEDSKTPLRRDLVDAGQNLSACLEGNLEFTDEKSGKKYQLEKEKRTQPIKRFPGLALPCSFLLYKAEPVPLHLYDFALHFFKNHLRQEALAFYVPKLENEEEAAYIKKMMTAAEELIARRSPTYMKGSIRLFIVLENPRAIFRTNEIIDALFPYFAGASLGWHDYLASTARLFKNDPSYRIPVKADPEIVIKYIKASHDLLNDVVGPRGGVKIGGMYGVLPADNSLSSPSFQITMKGYIKDVVTQMKRGLTGFWVAHPDFVRIGLALVEAWKQPDRGMLEELATSLLEPRYHQEILDFIRGPDIKGLEKTDPGYPRSLIVADIKESTFIANNHPDEIRYNVFQSLQYLTDWLCGNGCVALPAQIEDVPVRVMDDLATAERSRWEVWHELHHGRFSLEDFIKIVHEEMLFIRKDLSDSKKIVQVKWDARTAKWYPIAMRIMLQLMTAEEPVEFATELLLPFTLDSIRNSTDPWKAALEADSERFAKNDYVSRLSHAFEICGVQRFAHDIARGPIADRQLAEKLISSFDINEVKEAARFHGDIGEAKKTLDATAAQEQAQVFASEEQTREQLRELGAQYLKKFGFKYLVSAKGRSATELLARLEERFKNSVEAELQNARHALIEITLKRFENSPLEQAIQKALTKNHVASAQIAVSVPEGISNLSVNTTAQTWYELASLSKTLASACALEYFKAQKIPLETPVNALLERSGSAFRLKGPWASNVTLTHLMNHTALNMHYVNGVPLDQMMPNVAKFLDGNTEYGYKPLEVLNEPGTTFRYSGGGFLLLEHILEAHSKKSAHVLADKLFAELGLKHLSFKTSNQPGVSYAKGYMADGTEVGSGRLQFPAFAAGGLGTAAETLQFLRELTRSYQELRTAPISHDTAVQMLFGHDLGSREFMGADMGLGVFTAEMGPNRVAIHQGANDGFRCLFVHCFRGPDRNKGFVIFCNADNNGVPFIAEVAQRLLMELGFQGLDTKKFKTLFDSKNTKQEEVVNRGYKELIFDAFLPDLAEKFPPTAPPSPLATANLVIGSKILEVSNQGFAPAENLLSPLEPVFDPDAYGRHGKIMDSWETVRHNPKPCDTLVFKMPKASPVKKIWLSTQYHLGNQVQSAKIEALGSSGQWITLLEKSNLEGHAQKFFDSADSQTSVQTIRISVFPDGGLTRLGLFKELSADMIRDERFPPIPQTHKPLTPKFSSDPSSVQKFWRSIKTGTEVDVASAAAGAKIVHASNEHYGPATQIISPYQPLHMFDGFESARSRETGHSEEVIIELGRASKLHRIEINFTYFRHNNPREMRVEGLIDGAWIELMTRSFVKPYAGNRLALPVDINYPISQLKLTIYPDGGMNRVHAWTLA